MNLKWTLGNRKLRKSGVIGFGLPAVKTCPGAQECRSFCYACKGNYRYPSVIQAREFNLTQSRAPSFVGKIAEDLQALNPKTVRLHDSGDFYSQGYLNAWAQVARLFPRIMFYAYTKSLHLDYSRAPANLRIVQSQGGKYPIDTSRLHAIVFPTHEARESAGYADGAGIDLPSLKTCPTKIGLVLH